MAGSTEPSRHDLQRQALADMLSRFTADRDALIAAVQACQERLTKVIARLDGDAPPATEASGDDAPSTPPAQADEVRKAVMQVRLDLEMAVGHVRASAEQATERAEEALRRVKEMEMRLEELTVIVRRRP